MRAVLILIAGLCSCQTELFQTELFADPIPKQDPAPKIKGTTWEGETSKGEKIKYRFLDDGKLEWTTGRTTSTRGSWKQDGKKVTWETNNHYADYTGIVTKNEMKIEAKNVKDVTWTITLKPVRDEAKDDKKPE